MRMPIDISESQKNLTPSDIDSWLATFKAKHGRVPRVLHIGNIANNAYNNAKLLNEAGLDCDVICYDYYHVMGCPEWEDADFKGEIKDPFFPDWRTVNLNGFERPRWFAQGPLEICIKYLIAKRSGNIKKEDFYWKLLCFANTSCREIKTLFYLLCRLVIFFFVLKGKLKTVMIKKNLLPKLKEKLQPIKTKSTFLGIVFIILAFIAIWALRLAVFPYFCYLKYKIHFHQNEKGFFDKRVKYLVDEYEKIFPDRDYKLPETDFNDYKNIIPFWKELFYHYDFVHAYATDGIFPLLANKPYVAYEHGTIRKIPFQESTEGGLCALTYKLANRVCITNADNIIAAKTLKLDNYLFVPHPINEEFLVSDEKSQSLRIFLNDKFESDFIVFHPSRQHWEKERHPDWEKGNDIFIRGFAQFVLKVNPKAAAVFVDWGKSVDDSKKLLEKLGIADRVLWIQPQPNRKMIRYIHAADLVADQFYLGAFGSTMPKALACGKPAMLYVNYEIHKWCFEEKPPVINAKTEEEVYEGVTKLYKDKKWAGQLSERSRQWYEKYHSNKIIRKRLMEVYKDVLFSRGKDI